MSINSRAYILSSPEGIPVEIGSHPVEQEVSHVDYQEELRKVQQFNVVVSFVADASLFTETLAKVQQTIVVLRMLAKLSPLSCAQEALFQTALSCDEAS